MMAVVQGYYTGTKDIVEVGVLLREDDAETSLHKQLKTGSLKLLHNNQTIATVDFDGTLYNEEHKQFYFYFMHPPLQKNMGLLLEVELFDGRTTKERASVLPRHLLKSNNQLQNPSLPGRKTPDYTGRPPLKEQDAGFELL